MSPLVLRAAALCLAASLAPGSFPQGGRLVLETLAGAVETRPIAEPGELRFARDATVFLRCEGAPAEAAEAPARVELADGQRWSGDVAGGKGDVLRWKSALGPELALSVDHVTRIEFAGRVPALDRASLAPAKEGDRLYWVHGGALERVDGSFEAFADEGIVLESVLGKRTFPWREVGALFVAQLDSGAAPERPAGVPLAVDLADGSRLRAGFAGASAAGLSLNLAQGAPVVVPYARLVEASLDDGSFEFLSAIPPSSAREGSLFGDDLGLAWPHKVDQSVVGTPLSVAGQRFSRGLGVHAPSRLEWKLAPPAKPARELTGLVGIDDSVRATSARGSVRCQVVVDGTVRWDSGVLRGGEAPRALPRIDLRGAKELALVVDPAEDSFVADRADWLRLVVVREP